MGGANVFDIVSVEVREGRWSAHLSDRQDEPGPVMSVQPSSSNKPADPAVEAELDRLAVTPIAQLRVRYREVSRSDPPKAFGPDLLRRSIAHQIQEKAYGGLSRPAQRLLEQAIKAFAAKPNGKIVLPRRIKPGSVLVREWKGKSYRVMVLADGFAYDGKTFGNLSEIAVLITGTRWNGPRFFGLRAKSQEREEPAAPDRSGSAKRKSEAASTHSKHLGGGSDHRKRHTGGTGKSASNGGRHGR
jgi:hypothetical protein